MFGKPAVPAGGLTVNTSSANSLLMGRRYTERKFRDTEEFQETLAFEKMLKLLDPDNSGNAAQPSSTPAASAGGGLFGASTTTAQPQTNSLFPPATSQPQTGNLFGGLGSGISTSQQQPQPGGSLFGGGSGSTQQPGGGLFGGAATGTPQTQQQPGATGSSLFPQAGGTQTQTGGGLFPSLAGGQQQSKSLFPQTGQNTTTTPASGGLGLLGGANTQQQPQQQQQQGQQQGQQGPTLSLFGNQNAQQNKPATTSNIVQGVKIDLSNLAPTTKFESCSDELKREIENIDTAILNQVKMCNEVSDYLPIINAEYLPIPNDVAFVQGKLDTIQEALENDAAGIEDIRSLVKQDAAEAKLAFRALDTLFLPLQYQMSSGSLWSPNQQAPKYSLRSALGARHTLLALPEDAEADSSEAAAGGPANLVDYFSQRADDMNEVVERYRKNLKEIEDHLHGVEFELHQQINSLASAKSKDGGSGYKSTPRVSELAGTLGDVETAILGVASRLGNVKEEVQEMTLGPLGASSFGRTNGW